MPTRTIGGVSIDVRADDKDFNRAAKRSSENLKRFRTQLRKTKSDADASSQSLQRFAKQGLGALGGALAVRQLGAFSREALNALDVQIKYARGLGITTEALQEYIFAFEEAGVSEERTIRGLQRFQDELGRAVNEGFGGAILFRRLEALDERLASNIKNAQDAGEALDLFIQFLGRVSDAETREALALTALGRDVGPLFAAALAEGTAALDASRRQFREWGLALSDAGRDVQQINDDWLAFTRFYEVRLKGIILDFTANLHSLAEGLGLLDVSNPIEDAKRNLGVLAEAIEDLETQIAQTESFLANRGDLGNSIITRKAQERLKRLQDELRGLRTEYTQTQNVLKTPPTIPTQDITRATQSLQEYIKEVRNASDEEIRASQERDKLAFLRQEELRVLTGPQIDVAQIEASRAADQAALDAFNANISRGQELAVERQTALNNAFAAGGQALQNMGDIAGGTFGNIINGIGQTLELLNNLGNLLQSLAQLFGGLGGLSSGGGAGGASSLFSFLGFAQFGGRVGAGQPTVVGERRPELFVPDTAGRIYPSVPGGATYITENHYTLDPSLDPTQQQQFFLQAIHTNNRIQAQNRLRDMRRPTPFRETARETL